MRRSYKSERHRFMSLVHINSARPRFSDRYDEDDMVCSLVVGADGGRRVQKLVFRLCVLSHHQCPAVPPKCIQSGPMWFVSPDARTIFKICPCVLLAKWLTSFEMGVSKACSHEPTGAGLALCT
jgi:hypothetical protein